MAAGGTLDGARGVGGSPMRAAAARLRPLRIGLSARLMHDPPRELGFRGKTLQYLEQSMAHWIMAHEALAFMLPTIETGSELTRSRVSIADYVREIDGLVLQGGADVSPESYGEMPLAHEWRGDRVRDLYEIDLFWECVIQGRPVLGVCRGAQLINVALGGTLYQDIRTQRPEAVAHFDAEAYDSHEHEILIEPASRLSQIYGGLMHARVNSIHHQAVKDLGSSLAVEARSAGDGMIEAIRWSGTGYAVGLQWHPEFHRRRESRLLDGGPVLSEFLAEARRRSQAAAG